ncbi:MAG: hypothetical protein WC661_14985 [Opitutaceae bacterium]|jgi:hypothetical protein
MRNPSHLFLLMIGAAATAAWGEPLTDIPLASKRADTVKFAKSLIAPQPQVAQASDEVVLRTPFNPVQVPPSASPSASNGGAGSSPSGEDAQLAQIAPNIKPTGAVKIGDDALLLFGQKRFKVGDRLPIVFEGRPYELEIVDIQSTSFTLRLNGVEITRPIKSVTKPVTKP